MHRASLDIRSTALTGLLFSLAMVLSFFESVVSGLMALPPGIKPGLSNMVVLFALLVLKKRSAWLLMILKSLFACLTRGALAGLLSFSGGTCSMLVMLLLIAAPHLSLGYRTLSMAGACAHNIGQIAAAALIIKNPYLWYYLPVLLLAGMITGFLIGAAYSALEPHLRLLRLENDKHLPGGL